MAGDALSRARSSHSVTPAHLQVVTQGVAQHQAVFPKSANRTVMVLHAWRREDSTRSAPEPNGSDGWTPVNRPATREVIAALADQGYTYVNLYAGGTTRRHRDVTIASLLP